MKNIDMMGALLRASAERRQARRQFLRMAGGATALAGGLTLLAACDSDSDGGGGPISGPAPSPTPTPAPPPTGNAETDVLNFALQLEYAEANFYAYATTGSQIPGNLQGGIGAQGPANGGRAVNFTDPLVRQFAREIAADEIGHVTFLRQQLGSLATAQPTINLGGDATGAFTLAARAAGVVGANETFDPYANDENFLLGAFLLSDVGPTAYMGGVQFLSTPAFIEAAAGIHAVEAYHAGLLRTVLFNKGLQTPTIFQRVLRISDARDTLDGTANTGLLNQGGDRDQGIGDANNANLVPADQNAIVFVRSPGQVLNIVYLNANAGVTSGGFFPAGVNGTIRATG